MQTPRDISYTGNPTGGTTAYPAVLPAAHEATENSDNIFYRTIRTVMKKQLICLLASAGLLAAGCSTENAPETTGYGTLSVSCTADTSIDTAVKAVRNGAQDFLTKPIDMNRLLQSLHRTIDNPAPAQAPPAAPPVRRRRAHSAQAERIIGVSPEIEHVRQLIDKVAPCEARVLITGENGTGKELVARWLHAKSVRAAAPFVEVNCAAIPSELIESELFGHERGAFTSAVKQRKGKFEQADGGTLFMDEIGDMSLAAQAKVLRALQENRISRVGSDKDVDVDVRIIAATNKNLREEIKKGNFREDLFHRIGVILIKVPPLREHSEDIPLLVDHFIDMICEEYDMPRKPMDKKAVEMLRQMPWTGNIRELRNVIERLVVLSGTKITPNDVELYC